MELSNEFDVGIPIDVAWAVLTDVETIAPCLPGAALEEILEDGQGHEEYHGVVKVKVGPITAQYKGSARFASKDEAAHTAILSASGRDTRGQGTASATVTATLVPDGDQSTHVSVVTELNLTGKVAQFGRGVLADVSKKLLEQFVANLETTVLQGIDAEPDAEPDAVPSAEPDAEPSAEPDAEPSAEPHAAAVAEPLDAAPSQPSARAPRGGTAAADVAPVDLLGTAGSPVLKRLLPVLAGVAVVLLLLRRRRRRG